MKLVAEGGAVRAVVLAATEYMPGVSTLTVGAVFTSVLDVVAVVVAVVLIADAGDGVDALEGLTAAPAGCLTRLNFVGPVPWGMAMSRVGRTEALRASRESLASMAGQ